MVLSREDLTLALDLLTEAAVCGALTPEAIEILVEDDAEPLPRGLGFLPPHRATLSGSPGMARVRHMLDIFEHDGYLRREKDDYVFVSRLLSEWWKARFAKGFRVSSQRRGGR